MRTKADELEHEARQAKDQLAELARTATDYSTMIKKKEDEIERLTSELDASALERGRLQRQIAELQGNIETLTSELQGQHGDLERSATNQAKLREELDELRVLLAAKTTEETRRSEVERSKEVELAKLRDQVGQLSHELGDARRLAQESQTKLKVELDSLTTEYTSLQASHRSLSDREQVAQAKLKGVEVSLADAEKTRRSAESELHLVRSRQSDLEGQLADTQRAKEVRLREISTERHLTQSKRRLSSVSWLPLMRNMPTAKMLSCSWSAIRVRMTGNSTPSESSWRPKSPSGVNWSILCPTKRQRLFA